MSGRVPFSRFPDFPISRFPISGCTQRASRSLHCDRRKDAAHGLTGLSAVLLAGCFVCTARHGRRPAGRLLRAQQRSRCNICTLLPKARRCNIMQCLRPGCGGFRDPQDHQKLCACCKCTGCVACVELSELDKRLVQENPNLCWLRCGGVRSGAPGCPHKLLKKPNLKLKKKIQYCHACLSVQKTETKPKPDDQAAAAPPPTPDTVDGLVELTQFVLEETGKALPVGWRALLQRDAVGDAMQTGEFISPAGERFRTMQSVAQHVGQLRTCAAQHGLAAASSPCAGSTPLLPMETPPAHEAPASFGGARARGA